MYNHSSTGHRVSYPSSKAAVEDQIQHENYIAYQSQRQNIPPLPSTQAPLQYPLKLNEQYAPQNSLPDTSIPLSRFDGAEHAASPVVDQQILLLALAEEYLDAAHRMGSMAASQRRDADLQRYYKLIATGLGCLECLLQVCMSYMDDI